MSVKIEVQHHADYDLAHFLENPSQKEALNQLRTRITADILDLLEKEGFSSPQEASPELDHWVGDLRLLRFLNACGNNVEKASENYQNMLKWYQENNLSQVRKKILGEFLDVHSLPHVKEVLPIYPFNPHHFVTKEGDIFQIECSGKGNVHALLYETDMTIFRQWNIYQLEAKAILVDQMSRKQGRMVKNFVLRDLEGLGTQHLNRDFISFLKDIIGESQNHFPEMMGTNIIINSPVIFSSLWNLMKPWFNQRTLDKIQIFGWTNYQEELFKHIEISQLPTIYGGLCSCPHSNGCLPYFSGNKNDEEEEIPSSIVTVAARKTYSVPLLITEENKTVEWQFSVQSFDIKFNVLFTPEDVKKPMALFQPKLVLSTGQGEKGTFSLPTKGTITLHFDNSYSRLRSKTINFKLMMVV
eukprot:Lithocolla_globosa_v1_NODE_3541_length_1644_cov_1.844556.p1 type:complete len:413 gc:universal NODE_3541_length_1644_cov_1.844556:1347-109(-)